MTWPYLVYLVYFILASHVFETGLLSKITQIILNLRLEEQNQSKLRSQNLTMTRLLWNHPRAATRTAELRPTHDQMVDRCKASNWVSQKWMMRSTIKQPFLKSLRGLKLMRTSQERLPLFAQDWTKLSFTACHLEVITHYITSHLYIRNVCIYR